MGRRLVESPHVPAIDGALPRDVCLEPSIADLARMTGGTRQQGVVVLVLALERFQARLGRYRTRGGGDGQRRVDVSEAASRSPSLFQKSPASLVEVAASIRDRTIRR